MTAATETKPETSEMLTLPVGNYVGSTAVNDRAVRQLGNCGITLTPEEAEDYGWIGIVKPHQGMRCSLPNKAHDVHVYMDYDRIMGRWNDSINIPEETEVDPEPEPFEPEVGVLYKFRNRPTMLLFVDMRKDGRVEVLDLDHEKYRVLKREQLVPRRDDKQPTPQQMLWVAKFLSERRKQVRETAVAQKRDGYFKSYSELNGVLKELDMEPHTPELSGTFAPRFTVRAQGRASAEALKAELTQWLRTLPPPPSGITFSDIGARMNWEVYER